MSDPATPWTVPCQAPLSMEFSRQEYQSELPFPAPGRHHVSEVPCCRKTEESGFQIEITASKLQYV